MCINIKTKTNLCQILRGENLRAPSHFGYKSQLLAWPPSRYVKRCFSLVFETRGHSQLSVLPSQSYKLVALSAWPSAPSPALPIPRSRQPCSLHCSHLGQRVQVVSLPTHRRFLGQWLHTTSERCTIVSQNSVISRDKMANGCFGYNAACLLAGVPTQL